MAVKLRMTRIGRRHRPFFRINAIDSAAPRNGRILEKLGHYDPIEKKPEKQIVINLERVKYWLEKGAMPSDTISQILLRKGVKTKYAEQKAARRNKARIIAKTKGKYFTKADKIAAEKAVEEKAKEAEEKEKAKEAEKKAAEEKAKEAETKAAEEKEKIEAQKAPAESEEAKIEKEPQPEAQTEQPEPEEKTEPKPKAKKKEDTTKSGDTDKPDEN